MKLISDQVSGVRFQHLFYCLLITVLLFTDFAGAQQLAKIPRIGLLVASTAAVQKTRLEAFRSGLADLGFVEGKNIILEYRYADGKPDRLPELAGELIRIPADIIVAVGGTPPAQAAKKATQTIPIVIVNVADAVGDGLVASLSRPGGNITGLSTFAPELSGKRLELIKEMIPGISRVAVLANRDFQGYSTQIKEVEAAAHVLGLKLQPTEVRGPNDLEGAFASIKGGRAGAVMTLSDPVTFSLLKQVVELAIKFRIPSNHLQEEYANAGGLVSYGPSYTALFRRAPVYIDKILKGAKPGELPIEQPTKFELVINLKAAKQIKLTIPPNVLARADRVMR
jgi:putative ABC transport system substrate-binding protein